MVPPSRRLPEAPILQVSVIAVRRTINHNHCNMAMYVFFNDDTNFSSIYFTAILFAAAQHAHWLQVSF